MTQLQHSLKAKYSDRLATEIRGIFGKLKRRLRDQTDASGLSGPQMSVLGLLGNAGEATVTSLAREEGMRPQSMGAIVAALEDVGLVRGAPDPNDGRQTILSLTENGLEWIRAAKAARQDWLSRAIEAKLTKDQQKELGNAIELLKRIVEP